MSLDKALVSIQERREELAQLCSGLVQRPSPHPAGNTIESVAYIKEYFDGLGIANEVHTRNKEKPNIVAHLRGTSPRLVMWLGHLDVVPEGRHENWTYPPYSGKITEDGFIWGRGSSDCKGACAGAMVVARVLSGFDQLPNSVDFWFTADEEIGGADGARWLASEKIFRGDVCIVGDGTPGVPEAPTIDLGCKGGAGTRLVAKGQTAHGSTPYLGDNAVDKLLRVVPHVKKIGDYRLELPGELEPLIESTTKYMLEKENPTPEQVEPIKRLYHYPSVSLNMISGGVKSNVVPDYAEAAFDIRLTPGCRPLDVRQRILELVKEAAVPGVEAHVTAGETAGYYESPEQACVKQFYDAVWKATGSRPVYRILTGGTDAVSVKRYTGIPCIGFGAGMLAQAHAPDERNSVELIEMCAKASAAFSLLYKD